MDSSHVDTHTATERQVKGRWLALVLLCVAEFMLVLDITAVNVALPTIGRDLGAGIGAVTWVVTAYVVTFGGLMLLGGRLADVLGRRRLLLFGIVAFAASSALCAFTADIGWLVAGRAVQGMSAAMISPAALASIPALFSSADRGRALGAWAGVGAAGFAAGLILSGVLTAGPGWRWIFLVNVPVSLALVPALRRLVPVIPGSNARVDVVGGVLITVVAAALVYGLTGLNAATNWTFASFALAAVALVLFLIHERHHPVPLMPLRVLRNRSVLSGLILMLLASGVMLSTFFLGSLHLQHSVGLGPLQTGLAFLPAAIATLVSAHLAGFLLTRLPVRLVAAASFAVIGTGGLLLAWPGATASAWQLIGGLAVLCLGLGPAFVTATASALHRADHSETGLAAGIVSTGHEIGGALGIAAITAIVGGSMTSLSLDSYSPGYMAVAIGALLAAAIALTFVPSGKANGSSPHHGA